MVMTQASMTNAASSVVASSATRKQLILNNIGTKTVYIGDSNTVVSTANNAQSGYPLYAGEVLYLGDYNGNVYGICDGADTSTIAVLEESL